MTEQLGRRCALVLLAAMALALATGLLAWGPVPLAGSTHLYADRRGWSGLPNAFNVLVNLPLVAAAIWGLRATRASRWPAELRRAWGAFHGCVLMTGLLALAYHLHPANGSWLLATAAVCGAFVMLAAGVLAERVDLRFGRTGVLLAFAGLVTLAAIGVALGGWSDLRPFLWIEVLPILLIPAGAVSLPGPYTRSVDWIVMLAAFALAKLADIADAEIYSALGWISGHSLMHLGMAAVTGWMAYCARCARADAPRSTPSLAQTSLNTAG